MQYISKFVNFSWNEKVYCRMLIFYVRRFDNNYNKQDKYTLMVGISCNILLNLSISLEIRRSVVDC